jgi:hypothetical protein
MLTSAQIIARSQAEVASKLNTLLQYLPDSPTVLSTEVSPFGANQFIILVTWSVTAGLRTFAQGAAQGMKATVSKLHAKTPFAPLLGLKVAMAFLYNELFLYKPLLGLRSKIVKALAKHPVLLEGLKPKMWARQKPTRINLKIGLLIAMKRYPVWISHPNMKLGIKPAFGQILKNGIPIMPW